MKQALNLARQGIGMTRPNPLVGAVMVKNGKVIGEGYHKKAGAPHAEIVALREAGHSARGATLYVTLEPCSTHGRTPPCIDTLVEQGIRRVVVSAEDPNPCHAGAGLARLRREGIKVITGICIKEGRALIAPFKKWITTGCPFVTVKLGMTIDGKITDKKRSSKWITGPEARARVQELRRQVDGILVGYNTVKADDPSLLPRPRHGRKPYRIITDSRARIPLTAQVLNDAFVDQTIVAATEQSSQKARTRILKKGAHVCILPEKNGRISVSKLLSHLGTLGLLHILCEGGGALTESLIKAGLVDEYMFFLAPKIMGGTRALDAVGGTGWLLEQAPRLRFREYQRMGDDLLIHAVPERR